MTSKTKILITGGGGFIGFHLATALAKDPANDITLLENFGRGRRDDDLARLCQEPNVRLIAGDLCTPGVLDQTEGGYNEVYHMAAILGVGNVLSRPVDVLRVNAMGTITLLDWMVAGGGEKVLFASTSEVYAWTQQFHAIPIPTPEDVPLAVTDIANPRSTYAGSKIFGELAVTHWCRTSAKPFVVVRYHNIYGPRMGEDHVIPQLYKRATVERQNPLIVYSSDHSRAFCYVSDAVQATISAMRVASVEGSTLNIGNDEEEITIYNLAKKILEQSRIVAGIQPAKMEGDPIQRRCPDVSKARRLLGYRPAVPLDQGLDLTVRWYAAKLMKKESLAK